MKMQKTQQPVGAANRPPRRARAGLASLSLRTLCWPLLFVMLAHGFNLPFAGRTMPSAGAAAVPARAAAPAAEPFTVFGPSRFERKAGPPVAVTQSFALPADAAAPFAVNVVNGDADGSNRVSSATIKLNGVELFRPNDFNQRVAALNRAVTLTPTNTLEVLVRSAVGSHVTVTFTATRTQAPTPTLETVEPRRATQGQALSVVLRGRNTNWVDGQTRASFGGEISVGGAAPGEPGPVTVSDATTATAELVVSPTAALAPRPARVLVGQGAAEAEAVTLVNALTVVPATPPGAAAARVVTLAGTAGVAGFADGPGAQARFNGPAGVAVGPDDATYVADAGNHRVRVVRGQANTAGEVAYTVSTLAGRGTAGFADGPGAQAQFNNPQGVAVDAAGVVYVADTNNHRVRRVAPDGTVSTLAGDGTAGFADGAGAAARFNAPQGVAVDSFGNVYVADTGNAAVRKINAGGQVSTAAGDGTVGSADSPGARFDGVSGVACEGEQVFVYLADAGNHRLRRLDSANTVVTVAGAERGFADGAAGQARFAEPSGIALDGAGRIVVADAINSLVRLVDLMLAAAGSTQAVTTLAGDGERGASDGRGDAARFQTPRGVAVSASSAVVVADTGNATLRRVLLPPVITALSPHRARPGMQLTITGERFDGRAPARNAVRFTRAPGAGGGLAPAHVVSASRTSLTVEVPPDAGSGPVTVETEGGTATSPTDFELGTLESPSITDFNPKHGPAGTAVTLAGTGLKDGGADPTVTFAGAGGARLNALVSFSTTNEVRVLVPNGALSGFVELSHPGGLAVSPSPFTVESEQDFQLVVAPSTATAVQGGSATFLVTVNSAQPTFSQLARLSVEGLPSGVVAQLEPEQITAGGHSTLTAKLGGANLSPGSYPFTIKAVAETDGRELTRAAAATLNVLLGGQTTLSGRVLSTEGDPVMGATVSLDGRTATTDAAGSFLLSGVTAGLARPLMIDGRTASAPNRTYPIILEPADIVAGQANVIPYVYYLPPIDTQYEVELVPGQTTVAGNPRVPGLQMTIPADAVVLNRDGTPVSRVSITPLPVDRTPTPLPPNLATDLVYTSQPGGAVTNVPIPVVYPNLAGANPDTRIELFAFDHNLVRWYRYGFGRVSADGRTISPEIDPGTGRPYGLPDFSWHFPNAGPGGNPGGPGNGDGDDCSDGSSGPNPVDFSTGMKIEQSADISFGGGRGGLELVRIYTSDKSGSAVMGRFGRGATDNFDVRLTGGWSAGGAGRVVMPAEINGRLFNYARTDGDGALVFTSNATANQVGDAVRRLPDGTFEYRYDDGESMRFDAGGRLTAMTDRNGNTAALAYTGANLTRITDAVGRSIQLEYNGQGHIVRAVDPLDRVWRYGYDSAGIIGGGFLSTVTDPLGQITRYDYTGARLTSITDPRGFAVKRITYDGAGRVVEQRFADGGVERYAYALSGTSVTSTTVTDPLGRKTVLRFNPAGYLLARTDPLGQTTQIARDVATNLPTGNTGACGCQEATRQFDASGNPTSVTDRAGQTVKVEYDPVSNKVAKVTDKAGRVTTYRYDPRGNLLSTTNALNETASFEYNQFGQMTAFTDALNHTRRMEYDAAGNLTAQVDALGHRSAIEYDGAGRPTAFTDALGRRSGVTYDALDRVLTETDSAGAVTRYTYDANGNLATVTDALNHKRSFKYDAKNRMTSTTDSVGRVTTFTYNAADEMVGGVTPAGRKMAYGYNARGERTSARDPLGATLRFGYDNTGRLTTLTDQRGSVTTFVYDELRRLTGVRDPHGRLTSLVYDAAGNVTSTTDRLGRQTSFQYDALNRPARVSYPDATVTFVYDAAGRPARIDDTQGGSIAWAYDDANRVLAETTGAGAVSYSYNDAGQRTSMTAADRAPVTYGYDAAGRLETLSQNSETFTYGFDGLSRRTSLQRPNGVRTTYGYDAAGRLARLTHADAAGQALEDYQYAYTADDEIAAITSLASATALPATRLAAAADAANRIPQFGDAAYGFDNLGQTTSKTDAAGTTSYNWDARGRMTQAVTPGGQSVSYTYDALGRRSGRASGGASTQFLYDGSEVVLDRESGGQTVEHLGGVLVDEHLRQSSPATGPLYFLQDHLGSTAALADAGGNVVERQRYEPFGANGGSNLTRYGYTGRERDGLTGLVFNRARWYDPQQGRFLSEDPAGLSGGLNLYAYAGNNPLLYTDPFGLSISTFFSGLKDGIFEGVASAIVGYLALSAISALTAGTGGAALAVALAILAAYGLYQLYEQVKAIAEMWDACPDERDYQIGRLVGQAIGALLGGRAMKGGGGGGGGSGGGRGNGGGGNCRTCANGESCFVAGTPVQTAAGERRIEEVAEGDVVLSLDPERADASVNSPQRHRVTRTFVRTAPVVLDLRVGAETITATPEHPFYVVGRGWAKAGELLPGDLLLTKQGGAARLSSVTAREGSFRVFNFEVEGDHTYYVGDAGLLVHNSCGPKTLQPGPHAGESIPARGPQRDFTPQERADMNRIGQDTGCHTCGSTNPGTKSGNFVPDHQPPNQLNPTGGPQQLYPHCLSCSRTQGGEVRTATRP